MRKVKFLGYEKSFYKCYGMWVVGEEYEVKQDHKKADDQDLRVVDKNGCAMWERRACFEEVSTDD